MSLAAIIIVVIFAILLLVGVVVIGVYNKLSFRRGKVLDKFEAIMECLKERSDMIKDIVNIFNDSFYHEDSLVMDLDKLNKEINDNNVINNLLLLIDKSDDIIKKALSLDSIYVELKNNKTYRELKERFKNNQYKIMYAVEIYNEEVCSYNNYKSSKIIFIISKLFRFDDYNYYKK